MRLPALLLAACLASAANADGVIRTAADLYRAVYADPKTNASFDITATVVMPSRPKHPGTIVRDATGAAHFYDDAAPESGPFPAAGDVIHVTGKTGVHAFGSVFAYSTKTEIVGRGHLDPPIVATAEQIANGELEFRAVKINGILRDVFRDEIDLSWVYVILQSGRHSLYGALPFPQERAHGLENLIGTEVTLTCIPGHVSNGTRRMIKTILHINGPEDIVAKQAESSELFDVPTLEREDDISDVRLDRFARRRIAGRVIATISDNRAILQTAEGRIVRVKFASPDTPSYGTNVEVSGFATTDLYRINLSCAVWHASSEEIPHEPAPMSITPSDLFTTHNGMPGLNETYLGKVVEVRGKVLDSLSEKDKTFNIDWRGTTFRIDAHEAADAARHVEQGSVVEVRGVCVMEVPDWYPNAPFPHIEGFYIVARTPEDIVVLKRPPWWTSGRLAAVIGSLLTILAAVLAWNRSLRALAEKRGKALAKEEVERLASDLKAAERTRLSAELHDSIAQNLSGVSMELDTALNGDEALPPGAAQHLSRASKTLDSCRVELRNCIWDLRSRALDEPDMDKAIRVALGPTVGKKRLLVHFNVPRSHFNENTARTILNIVRELASNAIRHGHADEIRVAGGLDGDTLRFSVSDDGTGFDPENRPGVLEGHFGLQGIEERVSFFNGEMKIESSPGKGTNVSISIEIKGLHMS